MNDALLLVATRQCCMFLRVSENLEKNYFSVYFIALYLSKHIYLIHADFIQMWLNIDLEWVHACIYPTCVVKSGGISLLKNRNSSTSFNMSILSECSSYTILGVVIYINTAL